MKGCALLVQSTDIRLGGDLVDKVEGARQSWEGNASGRRVKKEKMRFLQAKEN